MYHPTDNIDFFGHNKILEYREYLDVLRNARVLLELPAKTQDGPTTRFSDGLLTMTKIITTNEKIKDYPFYNSNVLVINEHDPRVDEEFVSSRYRDEQVECMTVNLWLNRLLQRTNG